MLGAEAVLDRVYVGRSEVGLVDRDGRSLVLEGRQRLETDRRRHPLGRRHEYELVGAVGREPGERAGNARAEIEQHNLVERREEGHELAVLVRAEPRRQFRIARRPEDVEPSWQAGDVAPEL